MIDIRPLSALAEFSDAVKLQQRIWGFADSELLPLRFFVVASKIGGHVFGAYHDGEMVGFCFAIPGVKPGGRPYLHSHMLGVLPEYRDAGVGRRLKLRQREDALARGIDLIEWTFDPLEIKNAFFNIERLGAIVRRYVGKSVRRHLQPAAWRSAHGPLHRRMVDRFAASRRPSSREPGAAARVEERIAVPADIERMRRTDPARAREIQQANAVQVPALRSSAAWP